MWKMRQESHIPKVCALCGKALEQHWAADLATMNLPGYCEEHDSQVREEVLTAASMWPSNWAGRSWLDDNGRWRYN